MSGSDGLDHRYLPCNRIKRLDPPRDSGVYWWGGDPVREGLVP